MIELFLLLAVVGSLGIIAWSVLKLRRPSADQDDDWSVNRLEPSGWSSGVVPGAVATAASAAPTPVVDASASFGAGASFSSGADAGGGAGGGGSD